MSLGSLFSGIGGFELGLERSGLFRTAWQVEINPFCRAVLAKHWPHVERFANVQDCGRHNLAAVDAVCGGFPCQDVSQASHGAGDGLDGDASGLWYEYARIIGELQPRLVLVENVMGGAERRWLPAVRRDLHVLGYRTRAIRIDARDVGAPHARARIFVVGHADRDGQPARAVHAPVAGLPPVAELGGHWRETAPRALRMDDGLPDGVDRVEALGNAIVPQCAELLARILG